MAGLHKTTRSYIMTLSLFMSCIFLIIVSPIHGSLSPINSELVMECPGHVKGSATIPINGILESPDQLEAFLNGTPIYNETYTPAASILHNSSFNYMTEGVYSGDIGTIDIKDGVAVSLYRDKPGMKKVEMNIFFDADNIPQNHTKTLQVVIRSSNLAVLNISCYNGSIKVPIYAGNVNGVNFQTLNISLDPFQSSNFLGGWYWIVIQAQQTAAYTIYLDSIHIHAVAASWQQLATSFTLNSSAFVDGEYELLARASTTKGLVSDSCNITIDNTPPVISNISITGPLTSGSFTTISADVQDAHLAQTMFSFTIGNTTFHSTAGASGFMSMSNQFPVGSYNVSLIATDIAGNFAHEVVNITISPLITLNPGWQITFSNVTYVGAAPLQFNITTWDVANVSIFLNDTLEVPVTANTTQSLEYPSTTAISFRVGIKITLLDMNVTWINYTAAVLPLPDPIINTVYWMEPSWELEFVNDTYQSIYIAPNGTFVTLSDSLIYFDIKAANVSLITILATASVNFTDPSLGVVNGMKGATYIASIGSSGYYEAAGRFEIEAWYVLTWDIDLNITLLNSSIIELSYTAITRSIPSFTYIQEMPSWIVSHGTRAFEGDPPIAFNVTTRNMGRVDFLVNGTLQASTPGNQSSVFLVNTTTIGQSVIGLNFTFTNGSSIIENYTIEIVPLPRFDLLQTEVTGEGRLFVNYTSASPFNLTVIVNNFTFMYNNINTIERTYNINVTSEGVSLVQVIIQAEGVTITRQFIFVCESPEEPPQNNSWIFWLIIAVLGTSVVGLAIRRGEG